MYSVRCDDETASSDRVRMQLSVMDGTHMHRSESLNTWT